MARAKNGARIYWERVGPAIYQHPRSQQAVSQLGNTTAQAVRSSAAAAAGGAQKDRGGKMAAAPSLRLKDVRPFFSPKARSLTRGKARLEIPVALIVADHPASSKLENEEGQPVMRAAQSLGQGAGRWFKAPKQKKRRKR